YGSGDGVIIDESTPPAPDTAYARSKRNAEELVLAAPIGVVLRLAAVYGRRVKGNYRNLIRAVHRGRYVRIGSGMNRRTLIHELDAARAFVAAAESDSVLGSIFNVTDGRFHTLDEIVRAIATALGRKRLPFRVPVFAARAAAALLDVVRPSAHAGALLEKYLDDLAVDGSLFQRRTGFVPMMDLHAGWEATIRGMRDDGSL